MYLCGQIQNLYECNTWGISEGAADLFRVWHVQGESGSHHPECDGRQGHFCADADRWRKESVFPVTVPDHGRHGDRDLSADCADEEPGRCDAQLLGGGRCGALYQLESEQAGDSGSERGRISGKDETAVPGAGEFAEGRERGLPARREDQFLRRRWGALYLGMGTWFSSGVQSDPQYGAAYR